MDKQNQIEEMAKELLMAFTKPLENCLYPDSVDCKGMSCERFSFKASCRFMNIAENLYNVGYRKIFENALVIPREQYDKLILLKDDYVNGYEAGVNEAWDYACEVTAERFAEKVFKAIVDNTYPYFDKDGNPVNIWNALLGFDEIVKIKKEIIGKRT